MCINVTLLLITSAPAECLSAGSFVYLPCNGDQRVQKQHREVLPLNLRAGTCRQVCAPASRDPFRICQVLHSQLEIWGFDRGELDYWGA